VCLLIQLLPSPLSKEDFSIMRASFMLTHRVPKTFDFMSYIQNVRPGLSLGAMLGVRVGDMACGPASCPAPRQQ
jgi:hypothetical protein